MSVLLRAAIDDIRTWKLLATERRASVAVMSAIAMTSVVGMAGFALDLGTAYAQRARLQKVADSAAMAGAVSWVKTNSTAAVRATISAVVTANGWPASVIQLPAQPYLAASPKNAANPAIQVRLASASSLTLARVLSSASSVTTSAYSAVEIQSVAQSACLVALTTLTVNGTVNVSGCGVAANSNSSNAITVNGSGSLTAGSISTPGGVVNTGSIRGPIKTGAAPAQNPYTTDQTAASNGFNGTCQNYANQVALTPGCWSNANIGGPVTLAPGTYFFTGLNVNSGGSLTGLGTGNPGDPDFQGVTIVTQQSFSPNGNITLNAPTSGTWAGMAIYAVGGMNMNSSITYDVNGAIYAPTVAIYENAGTFNQSACTYLVGNSITFNSGAVFNLPQTNCGPWSNSGPTVPAGTKVALVQ